VFSFFGVILIARPEFLFGQHAHVAAAASIDGSLNLAPPSEKGTPTQRLIAVGYAHPYLSSLNISIHCRFRVALLGVIGATGACKLLCKKTREKELTTFA
jgi:hypothetical protein